LLRKVAEVGHSTSKIRPKDRVGYRSPRRKVIRLRAGFRSFKSRPSSIK
jgi:hypothetical protein